MKALLYDSPPWHGLPVERLSTDRIVIWDTTKAPPFGVDDFRGIDVVLIHVAEQFAAKAVLTACEAECRVLLFTGDVTNEDARRFATELRAVSPDRFLSIVPLRVLQERLLFMLERGDVSMLTNDRVTDVIELLSALWMVSVLWQRDGVVTVCRDSSGLVLQQSLHELGTERISIVGVDQHLDLPSLAEVVASSGRTLSALVSLIYRTKDLPNVAIADELRPVSRPEEFNIALASLRDVWLEWARGATVPNYANLR